MKTLLIVGDRESPRINYLTTLLSDSFSFEYVNDYESYSQVLDNKYYDYFSIIVDNPSSLKNAKKYFALVAKKNNYMLCQAILLLTDEENIKSDEEYLEDPVMGLIKEGETKKSVLCRVNNSHRLAGSTSFEEFSDILKNLPSLIYLKDAEGHYAFCTHHWHHIFDENDPDWTIRGKTDLDIRKDKNNALIAMKNDKKVVESGTGTRYIIKEQAEGEPPDYLQIIKEPIKNKKGEVIGIVSIINDVTDQELLKEQLRIKSITDPLTGLYNRLFLKELINSIMGKGGTIITADCDGLKQINDKFGHAAGDQYIILASNLLKDVLPHNSYIFRIGGDEFLALLPSVTAKGARKYVSAIMNNAKDYKTDKFALEISAGSYSMTIKSHTTMDKCIIKSDQKMYEAKKQRRLARQKRGKKA